jgi:hypothetical protein
MENQNNLNWGSSQVQQESPTETDSNNKSFQFGWGSPPSQQIESQPQVPTNNNSTYLGQISNLNISSLLYLVDMDINGILNELPIISNPIDEKNQKFDINPQKDSNIGQVIEQIHKIAAKSNHRVSNCHMYYNLKNRDKITLDSTSDSKKFIIFIKKEEDNGNVILDINNIQKPFYKGTENTIAIIPGWVPLSLISSDLNNGEFIALIGDIIPV